MSGPERDAGRIGILECGAPSPELAARFGSYDAMTRRMLGDDWSFARFAVAEGELPERVESCDGYVITGATAGVYESLPWIDPLLVFLRRARGRVALVGICFGHQALAQAFGGRVEKSAKGWGIGLHRYRVAARPGWMAGSADAVAMTASHQDQVVAPPPGAEVVLASAFTPFAGLHYGDAVSFQFHPEFAPDFARAVIESRRDRYGNDASDAALLSYAADDDRSLVAGWITAFLRGSMAGR